MVGAEILVNQTDLDLSLPIGLKYGTVATPAVIFGPASASHVSRVAETVPIIVKLAHIVNYS